ncbi:MAG: hypothetical protein AAF542_01105 [Pseudomonadota bacterium]
MKDPVKAVIFGIGMMGKLSAKYMAEKGVEIIGAYNRSSYLGESLASIADLDQDCDVSISPIEEANNKLHEADIALITAVSDLESLYPLARECLNAGVDVITLSEEAFFPPDDASDIRSALDQLAKENGRTIVSTGVQDLFWLNIPSILTGASHSIANILGTSTVNLDVYGPVVVSQFPIGLPPEQFDACPASEHSEGPLPIFGIALEALVANLGLTVSSRTISYQPIVDDVPVESRSLDTVISPGLITGLLEVYEIKTMEDIDCRVEFHQRIFGEGETENISWHIKGTPELDVSFDPFMGGDITCTTLVNRIPDVINAAPGFLIASDLAPIKYRSKSLHHYVKP